MVKSDGSSNGVSPPQCCRMLHGSPAASAMAVGGRREWSRFSWEMVISVKTVKVSYCLDIL